MVRKLMKYDFASYLRLILPVQMILLGIAAINRFVRFFEDTSSTVYNIIFTSSEVLYVIAVLVCIILTTVTAIVRFYQGMYSNEGYLSHTLPVTPTQHILSKLFVSLLFELGSLFAIFLSFCIVTFGELTLELFKAGFYLLHRFELTFGYSAFLLVAEFILALFAYTVMGLLMLYFCISVGQLAKRKKILLAFGVFFGLYVAWQIFGTVLIIIFSINPEIMKNIVLFAANHTSAFLHILLWGTVVFCAILGTAFFGLTRHLMSKKLNLA